MTDLARLIALHRQKSTPRNARAIIALNDRLFDHPYKPPLGRFQPAERPSPPIAWPSRSGIVFERSAS